MMRFAPSSLISSGTPRSTRSHDGTRRATVPARRPGLRVERWALLMRASLDDQRRNHADHPVIRLGVRKNVAVACPRPGIVAVDDHIPPFAGSNIEGVALPGS